MRRIATVSSTNDDINETMKTGHTPQNKRRKPRVDPEPGFSKVVFAPTQSQGVPRVFSANHASSTPQVPHTALKTFRPALWTRSGNPEEPGRYTLADIGVFGRVEAVKILLVNSFVIITRVGNRIFSQYPSFEELGSLVHGL